MPINGISNFDALAFVAGLIAFVWLLLRVIPSVQSPSPRTAYDDGEITAHDGALPKYFIASSLALFVGGVHALVKNVPAAYVWLLEAGYGGHLARDIANTHLVIVVGGTVAATGLTWYALPRIARRPLASHKLATFSFWCTVLGAGGFYVSNVVLGVVLGQMVRHGWDYQAAKDAVGGGYKVPIGIFSSIMGVGYWTFVANVLLTVWLARHIRAPRPQAHLLKFFVVGALGLFAGTVQGVIQVLPAQARWIHAAGAAGEYIDPIAHAHINLITGTLSLVAGLAFFQSAQMSVSRRRTQIEQAVFWVMIPGSLLFYGTFMALGLAEGRLMLREHLTFAQAVDRFGPLHVIPLMVAGTWTLVGVWMLLGTLAWRFARGAERTLAGAPLLVGATVALFVGTLQGLIQLMPVAKAWIEGTDAFGDAVVNVHAQLNMIGGVMLALFGLTFAQSSLLVRASTPSVLPRRVLAFVGGGIALYYTATLVNMMVAGQALRSGGSFMDAIRRTVPLGPLGIMAGAGLYAIGFGLFFRFVWSATAPYRAVSWRDLRNTLARYNGQQHPWRRRIPSGYFLAVEALAASAGFPGLGWIMSGRPLIGLPLAMIGPAIAWGIIPLLASPYGSGLLTPFANGSALVVYLGTSTVLSSGGLCLALRTWQRRTRHGIPGGD
ncbi:MAG: cbb3-type cytochrome c oxidase subunit I [Chloroflexota bacterium]|nr:cbb3-type cytochrome c oxidase subunit I [Chloroflexota bacterium]